MGGGHMGLDTRRKRVYFTGIIGISSLFVDFFHNIRD